MDYGIILLLIFLSVAAWYAWRYYNLRQAVDEYASQIRRERLSTEVKELEDLSSSISSLISTFNLQGGGCGLGLAPAKGCRWRVNRG